jgi:hypothetical protein
MFKLRYYILICDFPCSGHLEQSAIGKLIVLTVESYHVFNDKNEIVYAICSQICVFRAKPTFSIAPIND